MVHMETDAQHHASRRSFGSKLASIAAMIAAVRQWRRTVATRSAISELTSDQLKDIGLSEAPQRKLVVKAGLITNLMSMR